MLAQLDKDNVSVAEWMKAAGTPLGCPLQALFSAHGITHVRRSLGMPLQQGFTLPSAWVSNPAGFKRAIASFFFPGGGPYAITCTEEAGILRLKITLQGAGYPAPLAPSRPTRHRMS